MKNSFNFLLILALCYTHLSLANDEFPKIPELSITTGKLCDYPISKRYPEGIDYCERSVSYSMKESIIHEYDHKFGYKISTLPREDFKVDHFIPLCAGGSNDLVNLWPQHKSVYSLTDPIEPLICEKMANGKLKQKEAIELIKVAKTNHDKINQIKSYLNNL